MTAIWTRRRLRTKCTDSPENEDPVPLPHWQLPAFLKTGNLFSLPHIPLLLVVWEPRALHLASESTSLSFAFEIRGFGLKSIAASRTSQGAPNQGIPGLQQLWVPSGLCRNTGDFCWLLGREPREGLAVEAWHGERHRGRVRSRVQVLACVCAITVLTELFHVLPKGLVVIIGWLLPCKASILPATHT